MNQTIINSLTQYNVIESGFDFVIAEHASGIKVKIYDNMLEVGDLPDQVRYSAELMDQPPAPPSKVARPFKPGNQAAAQHWLSVQNVDFAGLAQWLMDVPSLAKLPPLDVEAARALAFARGLRAAAEKAAATRAEAGQAQPDQGQG